MLRWWEWIFVLMIVYMICNTFKIWAISEAAKAESKRKARAEWRASKLPPADHRGQHIDERV